MLLRFLYPRSDLLAGWTRRCMSAKTTVLSFGDGSHGALGLPASQMGLGFHAYEPTPLSGLPPDVSAIAAGHYHSLAVTSLGHLWAWGRNSEAQLGRDLLSSSSRESWNEPRRVEGLNQVRVRAAFASGVISSAIGDDGSLWVWGKSKRGQLGLGKGITEAVSPKRVEALLDQEIVKVSLGWGHALALTKDGKLFGWGYHADGRLGTVGKALEASPLDSIAGDGTLLSGGSNVYGQLGREKSDLGLHPVDIQLRPVSIVSGLGHSLAICEHMSSEATKQEPSVVTWGWNQNSQLGREGPENVPTVVESLDDEKPISVSGGRVHSIAVTAKQEVWSWGCGRNGRLGLGSSADEFEPMLVESLEGLQVLGAVAGFDHNLVLVAE
ncbi:ultraviolet-B receptor UVR8 isoform X3 [Henckelia pumila]|uniref:ultraviolet-B receptor UVR8 isoform X3 n=1 Tax=Henckelia pumila TaxID=405737 RepID=UPI003C6E603C